jgi:hypothetical protein
LRAGCLLGETTFGENVATTLLTPLAEVEADTSFSPTLMVVLTALACEYAGHVPVSPLQLLCGLGRRLMSFPCQCIRGIQHLTAFIYFSPASIQEISLLTMIRLAAECQEIPPEPISDVQHLRSISGRHISRVSVLINASCLNSSQSKKPNYQRCSLFEDMIGKRDELRAAVANSRSRSVRTIRSGSIYSIDALNYNIMSASRLSPRARCQAIGTTATTSPPFLLKCYIAIIAQRNTEAPIRSIRASTTLLATSP